MANTRNIPLELAQVQRERGYAMTRHEFRLLGYTEEQLSTDNVQKAAEIFQSMSVRRVA